MKKFHKTIGVAMLLAIGTSAAAQQLPNGGFETAWADCVPWTSKSNTKTIGTQPGSWTISHVIGINGTGKTAVASQVAGYNGSASAVELVNSANTMLPSQTVPGYITLGTTWSTSIFGSQNDGGTFGGIDFTHTPDALSFYYKRSHGTASSSGATTDLNEPATVLVYLWKGSWSQADVPGNIEALATPTKVTMVDRERNILGIATEKGGAVTASDDAELIASLNYSIEGDAAEWTRFIQPLEYKTTSTPEKLNVIIAANDYFAGASAIGQNNTLTVDEVSLVYYSRLSALSINGVDVDGFASDVYNYNMSGTELPTEEQISVTLMGRSATKSVAIDADAATVTITVINSDVDVDGQKSHTYVLQYEKAPAKEGVATDYPGYLNVTADDGEGGLVIFAENKAETVTITHYDDNTCDFLLPNFQLEMYGSLMNLGDIKIEGATVTEGADGSAVYSGSVDGMQLEFDIVADVTLNGTISQLGVVNMKIDVVWEGMPINCTFTTNTVVGIEDVTTEAEKAVDVYSVAGVKVLENVLPSEAVKLLDKGFYIVGNKKVIVK